VSYAQTLSARAIKDLDALDNKTKKRMLDRISELADGPYDPRLSIKLTNQDGLRRSRVAGWRIIFLVDDKTKTLSVVTIERRGQVYKRV
jgi:mRNA interferase RelE/StbE